MRALMPLPRDYPDIDENSIIFPNEFSVSYAASMTSCDIGQFIVQESLIVCDYCNRPMRIVATKRYYRAAEDEPRLMRGAPEYATVKSSGNDAGKACWVEYLADADGDEFSNLMQAKIEAEKREKLGTEISDAEYPAINPDGIVFPHEVWIAYAVSVPECGLNQFIVEGSTQICSKCYLPMFRIKAHKYVLA